MKITRILLLGSLLAAFAAPALANEKPIVYTVKKGDTLWGISKRFIKDPDYWPNLWSHNPTIGNPHLIYPGQTLHIYDGRIEIVPVAPPAPEEAPVLAAEEPAPMITAEALRTVEVNVHGAPHSRHPRIRNRPSPCTTSLCSAFAIRCGSAGSSAHGGSSTPPCGWCGPRRPELGIDTMVRALS